MNYHCNEDVRRGIAILFSLLAQEPNYANSSEFFLCLDPGGTEHNASLAQDCSHCHL
jgi:hypothetical protein